jgi:hypothetical protein
MASILKVDTITGIATAGSIAITGEGNSTTTNLQQGLAKAFCSIELDDTVEDSFNATSFTDNGTGDITHTLASAMSNKNHSTIGFNIRNNTGGTGWCGGYGNSSDTSSTTTTARIYHLNASNVPEDMRRAMMVTHGDLA